jgi:hypothetical protein
VENYKQAYQEHVKEVVSGRKLHNMKVTFDQATRIEKRFKELGRGILFTSCLEDNFLMVWYRSENVDEVDACRK